MPKMEPAPLTFNIPLPTVTTNRTKYIDLSQIASILNRRAYRQGLQWAVQGFTLHTFAGAGTMDIHRIPQTWSASGGWMKTMSAWNRQQMEAIEKAGAESAVARFRDFKIFADEKHVANGFGDNLLPGVKDANALTPGWIIAKPGEWEASQIILPNAGLDPASGARTEPRENYLHMTGANEFVVGADVSRGIIEGYADSRAFPQSPDPVSPVISSGNNWLRAMFDVGNDNEEITENATDKNDDLPYNQIDYPGGQNQLQGMDFHDTINITSTTVSGKSSAKGGVFPCGLIRLKYSSTLGADPTTGVYQSVLQIHLVPGGRRGYLTERMQEM